MINYTSYETLSLNQVHDDTYFLGCISENGHAEDHAHNIDCPRHQTQCFGSTMDVMSSQKSA